MKAVYILMVGLLLSAFQMHPGDWYIKNYYTSGQMKEEGWLLKNKKTAYWYYYYDNGKIESQGSYVDDLKNGFWKSYYPDGKSRWECEFEKGKKTGWYTEYYSSGDVRVISQYSNGLLDGWYKEYEQDGTIKKMGKYHNGRKDYYWKKYEAGKLLVKEEWEDGKRNWALELDYREDHFGVFEYYKGDELMRSGTFEVEYEIISFYQGEMLLFQDNQGFSR